MSRAIHSPGTVAAALALVGAGMFVPIAAPAKTGGDVVQRTGIVRADPATGAWSVLSNPAHTPAGVTGVSCSHATGALTVTFTPVASIGTFIVGMDETYVGRYDAGASAGLDRLVITIRRPSTGEVVACDDPALRLAGSNIQVTLWGVQ